MKWDEAHQQRKELMAEVVDSLTEVEKNLLVWLLGEEKRNRNSRWHYKKGLRERLSSLVHSK